MEYLIITIGIVLIFTVLICDPKNVTECGSCWCGLRFWEWT